MRFQQPLVLFLLFLLPLLYLSALQKTSRLSYSSIEVLKKFRTYLFNPRAILTFLRLIALACCILALARPQAGKVSSQVISEGVDIFLVLDTSGSMQALDFKRNNKPVPRIDIVKEVAARFIKKRPGDRLGLVVFAEEAFTQCPLTMDHGVLLDFLDRVHLGIAGDTTAIGDAIATAVNRIKDIKAKSKVVILLTDGQNNTGRFDPQTAAEMAETLGVKVYTIGVGTNGKAPFLVNTIFGQQYVYQQVDLDEDTLKKIATTTHAKYFRATDTEQLTEIYDEIDKMEKTEVKIKEYTEYNELFHYFLFIGLVLLLIEVGLSQTRLRVLP